jgi:ATP-binding cassette subfamily F protein 3
MPIYSTLRAAQARFEDGRYEYTVRIQQVLGGLADVDFQRPISQLGGQKTRALLARLLLEEPDLLILDEPTNHLDIQAVEWLERWLRSFKGALLVVSHDRYFMDSVVGHVWELMFGHLEEYRGNYSAYIQQREERHAHLISEYQRQQAFVEKTEEYIARNISGEYTPGAGPPQTSGALPARRGNRPATPAAADARELADPPPLRRKGAGD